MPLPRMTPLVKVEEVEKVPDDVVDDDDQKGSSPEPEPEPEPASKPVKASPPTPNKNMSWVYLVLFMGAAYMAYTWVGQGATTQSRKVALGNEKSHLRVLRSPSVSQFAAPVSPAPSPAPSFAPSPAPTPTLPPAFS